MTPVLDRKAQRLLRDRFHIHRLRPGQAEVMTSVLDGRDTLAVMPTGSGKSLCYQLPALHEKGVTVVVSPLIALMQDQGDKLAGLGVEAAVFNSATPAAEQQHMRERLSAGRTRLLITTPEHLADAEFIGWVKSLHVALFVIDEAHCISQWGHDFRPAFLEIPEAIRALGRPTVLALTATATDEVIQDIGAELDLPAMRVIKVGVYRRNLDYAVRQVTGEDEKQTAVRELAAAAGGPAIVYTATVKEAEALHAMLEEAGESVGLYHGRLGARERERTQDAFMAGEFRVMVATNAFGMGIDKPDVRLVLHAQLPGSLDAYYQESGRAGRDGERARCVLIHEEKDRRIQQFFLANRYPSEEMLEHILAAVRGHEDGVALDELRERLAEIPQRKLQVGVRLLADAGLLSRRAGVVRALPAGDARERAHAAAGQYRERAERDRETLESMVHYARSGACRWRLLLEHFGDTPAWNHCGHCDSCVLTAEAERVARTVELPEAEPPARAPAPAFTPGEEVAVRRYGRGVVAAVTRERVDIRFPDGALRRFVPRYVKRLGDASAPRLAA